MTTNKEYVIKKMTYASCVNAVERSIDIHTRWHSIRFGQSDD